MTDPTPSARLRPGDDPVGAIGAAAADGPVRRPELRQGWRPKHVGRASALRDAAAAVGLAVWMAVSVFRPFITAVPQVGLDASWATALGEAADRHLRWGVDVAFPYGPASTLVTHYGNAAYLSLTLPLVLMTCLLFGVCAVMLVPADDDGLSSGPGTTLAMVAAIGLVASSAADFIDAVVMVLPLLPVLLVLGPARARRGATWLAIAMAAVIGAVGMAKMGYPVAALPLFLVADAALLIRRRPPVLTLPFLAGFLAGDLAYGQSLADLPAFLRLQEQVVAGYSDAMAFRGSNGEVLAFASSAGLLLALAVAAGRAAPGRSRSALPLATALTVIMLLKAGFVRQDLHTKIAWSGLALVAVLLAWTVLHTWRRDAAWAVLACAMAGAIVLSASSADPGGSRTARATAALAVEWDRLVSKPTGQFAAAWRLLRHPWAFAAAVDDAKAERWQELRELFPLPHFDGSVDVIPSIQSRVLASGLDYRPRPSFQEYATYTPELLAANRAFIQGPRAPDRIIFGQEPGYGSLTIDHRYPNFAEGALWPDLMRLYGPECSFESFLVLRRRAVPATLRLGDLRQAIAGFDEAVPVSTAPFASVTFARIAVRYTLLGRIAALLFRPVSLRITVTFADGQQQSYRFIPGIGAAGFVVSPMVDDDAGFLRLAQGQEPPVARRVAAFEIHAPTEMRSFVASEIDIAMQSISIDPTGATDALEPCDPAT